MSGENRTELLARRIANDVIIIGDTPEQAERLAREARAITSGLVIICDGKELEEGKDFTVVDGGKIHIAGLGVGLHTIYIRRGPDIWSPDMAVLDKRPYYRQFEKKRGRW